MAAVRHLVDTSVLSRMNNPLVRAAVGELAPARCNLTDLEMGSQARNLREWEQIMAGLADLEPVPTTAGHIERALQVQRLLAQRSQRGRKIPDLIIAAAAEEHGMTVLHYDADFDLIAAVTGQPTEWVVPAGTVD